MEILAILAVIIISVIGCVVCNTFFRESISGDCLYFSPAIGIGTCGLVAYVASHTRAPWLISIIALLCVGWSARYVFTRRARDVFKRSSVLAGFTVLSLFCVYAMQITLYALFARIYPGPHEVWTLFHLTGTPPPDQMFAWHQAMFVDLHHNYPQDAFYADMDLYDRPHLGGYVTLLIFRLFHFQLNESNFTYRPSSLRFYHCFWWLLNDCYLLGIAPLFRKLFGIRIALLAIAATALGGIFFLTTTGGWVKFVAAYPFLLALLLFARGKSPILQALLCVTSYYLHGSMLPFLLGFGLLYIVRLYRPIGGVRSSVRDVVYFGIITTLLIGAWFAVVKVVGSKQPLFYYYVYDADLTQAQTEPVQQIARKFYQAHSWQDLALLPLRNIAKSFFPWPIFLSWQLSGGLAAGIGKIASTIFGLQRFSVPCALGVIAAPLVLIGAIQLLGRKYSGSIALCIYLLPTLLVALVYRKEWAFQLHIMLVYHVLALALWAYCVRRGPPWFAFFSVVAIALEGIFCVLFADQRFLPANGIQHFHLVDLHYRLIALYVTLVLGVLGATHLLMSKCTPEKEPEASELLSSTESIYTAARRVMAGALVSATIVGIYSIYCLRFY
jgi:hypothetical protein